jgi:hypothetical protein
MINLDSTRQTERKEGMSFYRTIHHTIYWLKESQKKIEFVIYTHFYYKKIIP